MKRLAKALLAALAAGLPAGAREAVFMRLARTELTYRRFVEVARFYHVVGLTVDGRAGSFRSSVEDMEVLGTYARTGQWAERTNELLRAFFAERGGGTYLDVGANIGLTTVPVAANPAVTCFALEPEPTNYENLIANVRANCSHENVTTFPLAAYHERATVRFELADGNLGDHRIRREDKPGALREEQRPTIAVEAVPLDELLPELRGPVAVKLDVQGAEPFVLAGAPRVLAATDLFVMEFWPYGIARMGGDPEILFACLEREFDRVRFAYGETAAAGAPHEPPAAIEELRRLLAEHADDEPFYLDVVAERIGSRVGRPDVLGALDPAPSA